MGKTLVYTVRACLAMALLSPLIVMADPLPFTFFPFIVGKALWARTMIEIAFGLWIVVMLRYGTFRMQRSWLPGIVAAYVLIALAASLFSVSPNRSLWSTFERMEGWVSLAHWFVFLIVLTSVFRSWRDWRWLLNFNLGVSVVLGLLGLTQYFDISPLIYLQTTTHLDITLGNQTYVGGYMMVNVLIATAFLTHSFMRPTPVTQPVVQASKAVERRRKRQVQTRSKDDLGMLNENAMRAFWIFTLLLDFLIFYLTGTQGAAFGLLLAVLTFGIAYLLWGKVRPLRLAAAGMLGVVALTGVIGVGVIAAGSGDDSGGVDSGFSAAC